MSVQETIFTIFDTETTGFYADKGDKITEIAAIKVKGTTPIEGEIFDSLVNPHRSIPVECVNISGITDEMVASAPSIDEVLPKFLDFVGDSVLVAHNARFDMSFLNEELFNTNPFARINNDVVCTKELSKTVQPNEKFHSLDSLVYRYGLTKIEEGRHRALPDVYVLHEVFTKLIEASGVTDLPTLLSRSKPQ